MKNRYLVPRLRIALVREGPLVSFPASVARCSSEVAKAVAPLFADADRESFWVLALDGKNVVIAPNRVSEGSLTASLVHPREVFKPLILSNAAAFLCVHNPTASQSVPVRRFERGQHMASAGPSTVSATTTSPSTTHTNAIATHD